MQDQQADRLGKVTGIGQTQAGIMFLGASTSLPGLIVSFETAMKGQANLAVSNSIGGIAVQTFFIAIADVALRKKKLTHEDTLSGSLMQSTVVISLLSLVSLAMFAPELKIWHIHPITPVIILFISVGLKFIQKIKKYPAWIPKESAKKEKKKSGEKEEDEKEKDEKKEEENKKQSKSSIFLKYALYLALVGTGGWLISYAGGKIQLHGSFRPVFHPVCCLPFCHATSRITGTAGTALLPWL